MTRLLAAALAVSILSFPSSSRATAVTVCADKSAVVVSADSKLTVIGDARTLHVNKIVPVGDRTVVTLTGVAVWTELKYDFWSWVRRSTADMKADPAPADVAEVLRKRATELFRRRGAALAQPGMATYFVVAGLDSDGVSVWEIHVQPDGALVHVVKQRKFGPYSDGPLMFGWGFPASLPFDDAHGPLWAAVRQQTPSWLSQLASSRRLNTYQRASMCGIPIAVAAEREPFISLPINQALVSPTSGVLVATWAPPPQQETSAP